MVCMLRMKIPFKKCLYSTLWLTLSFHLLQVYFGLNWTCSMIRDGIPIWCIYPLWRIWTISKVRHLSSQPSFKENELENDEKGMEIEVVVFFKRQNLWNAAWKLIEDTRVPGRCSFTLSKFPALGWFNWKCRWRQPCYWSPARRLRVVTAARFLLFFFKVLSNLPEIISPL